MAKAMRSGKKLKVVFLNILKYFIIAKGGILILGLKVRRFLRIDIIKNRTRMQHDFVSTNSKKD